MSQQNTSFSWVRKVATHLEEANQIPLFGNSPSFDWNRFSTLISSRFGTHHFSIQETGREWKSATSFSNDIVIPLRVTPIGPGIFWLMSEAEARKLATHFVRGQSQGPLLPPEFADGFYRYLLLQGIDCLQSMDSFQRLSIEMEIDGSLPKADLLCVSIELSFNQRSIFGTLAITQTFHRSWIQHFSSLPPSFGKHAMSIELSLAIQVGSVELETAEWTKLKLGDAIILDQGAYDPRKQLGMATVAWQGIPLFHARIKHHKIELVEPASTHEAIMNKKSKDSHPILNTPVHAIVELGRLQMPLEKLMQLSPGNILELPIHPEQLVSLTVNGEVVAKGELLHLGETLSLRITSL